jgi:hypothetical protein
MENTSRMARWIAGKFRVSPTDSPDVARTASGDTRDAPRTSMESGARQRPTAAEGSCANSGAPASVMARAPMIHDA